MARLPRLNPPGIPLHIIQRGNNRQLTFAQDKDFRVYRKWLAEAANQAAVEIHAYVFMSNHVHILATPTVEGGASRMMQALGRRYVRYFNTAYERSGTLWEGRYRSCLVQSERYVLECYRYIENNPVRAGIVADPGAYRWSSYRCNARGQQDDLVTPHGEYRRLVGTAGDGLSAYRALVAERVDDAVTQEMRDATNKNLALGDVAFKNEVETKLKRRVRPATIGRPRESLL